MKGKHIILGITGGIAAYKSASLLRLFVKAGAEVQVVMTPNAKEFITPVTLSALSGKPVVSEFFSANTGEWHSHVDLGLWADAMVIAPATASSIAKMANGVADNMLITTYLSAKAPVFIAPAMDLDMMAHPSTTRNLNLLQSYGNHIIEAECGVLASHLIGKGRMAEPEQIFETLQSFFNSRSDLQGKKVVITAGPTHEAIDPVRFIGNYSTGKMGYAIADEAARRGADVTVISGPVAIKPSQSNIKIVDVTSARQMLDATMAATADADIVVLAAAVADFAPAQVAQSKIKREKTDEMNLLLVRNPDIAASVGAAKTANQFLVGFALETDHERDNAVGKMKRKNLDMIVLNSLRNPGAGFGTDTNLIEIFTSDGNSQSYPLKSKREVAADILDAIVKQISMR
ncbi:MAG: bifunctional phosphopantothenoylcysteine decarboxylase/phosphopantothenate--cysteine ligase CoaBC [Muribaculaceae bacterium]|nr:bifunctional phosphopantothenoylcysteine decarboxylase/phosphopantothenate--cysteine ligase CoaBC [Muribaculaceae bacterium]